MQRSGMYHVMHPVRIRIIETVRALGEASTNDMAAQCPDIPQATLYRHISGLKKCGVLTVVRENRTSGIPEKIYRLTLDPVVEAENETKPGRILELFYEFLFSLSSDMRQYLSGESADPVRDGMGFRYSLVWLDNDEFQEFCREWRELLKKYSDKRPSPSRKMRRLATVFIPLQAKIEREE